MSCPPCEPGLFRIAHHRSLNAIASRRRQAARVLLDAEADAPDDALPADGALERAESVDHAMRAFLALPAAQRACVILKDVLDCYLDEVGEALTLTVPAVKAALHRGRAKLAGIQAPPESGSRPEPSPQLARYVDRFNHRDWDGVRAMLAEDVQLDLVSHERRRGRAVAGYLTNYASLGDWQLTLQWLEGEQVIVVRDGGPAYLVRLELFGDKVQVIHDYRYLRYLLADVDGQLR